MSKWVGCAAAAVVGFVVYCAATGTTVADCCMWVERQTGVRLRSPDVKNVPHPAYSPVVLPGR